MKRIITFGEIMMRLNPEGYRRFVQADRFEASYAGGEANVAVSLSQLGMGAAFVSKVPAHEIGQCAINALRRYGVDTRSCARFGCGTVAITLRGSRSASDNDWSVMLYTGGEAFFSPTYRMHIVDRVGGGDSFGGALIYALLKDYAPQEAINYAVAASCLKHSIEQDFNLISDAEAASLAAGNTTGRVQR